MKVWPWRGHTRGVPAGADNTIMGEAAFLLDVWILNPYFCRIVREREKEEREEPFRKKGREFMAVRKA